jgi:glycopeptide antibiotics resistance protein
VLRKLLTVLLAAAPLFAAAFPWGEMTDEAEWWRVLWLPFVSGYRVKDVILNVLITLPVGVAAAIVVRRRPLATALGVTVAVSTACEWAQVYAPDRYPSGTDIFCNVAGAVAGVLFVEVVRPRSSPETRESQTRDPREAD